MSTASPSGPNDVEEAAATGKAAWRHVNLQRPAFEIVQAAEDEDEVCTAMLIGLEDVGYPNAMISFLEIVNGRRVIVADARYATGIWKQIAPATRRPYDRPRDLLPLVLQRCLPRYVADSRADPEGETDGPLCKEIGLISQYAIPLRTSTLEIGTLQIDLGNRIDRPPPKRDLNLLDAVAAHLSIAIERCRLLDRVRTLENETADRNQLLSFGTIATGTIHSFRKEMKKFLEDLEQSMDRVSVRSNKDALTTLRNNHARAADWLERVEDCIRSSQPGVFAVESIVADTTARLRAEWGERLRSLRVENRSEGTKVKVWEHLLSEVLKNLMINAIEAKARRIDVIVTLRRASEGSMVEILVRDDGEGISDALRTKVQRFGFTTKSRFGTGLGLPVSELLMNRMDGQLLLLSGGKSAGEEFTEFACRLPIASE
jgi:signal transduction histidine kinase